jgi:hypothetical protein
MHAGAMSSRLGTSLADSCGPGNLQHHRAFAPAAGTAHPPGDVVAGRAKLVDAAIDRASHQSSRPRGCRHTAQSVRQSFVGCKQASATVAKEGRRQLPARPDVVYVDHAISLAIRCRVAPTKSRFYPCVLKTSPIRLFRSEPLGTCAGVRGPSVGQGAGAVKSWSGKGLLSGTLITTISCPVA